ncbi:MAG: hypothetical protein WBQ86_01115, partial [Candidatus Binatus sp.]
MRKFGFGSISQITRISSLLVAVAMLTTAGAAYAKTSKPLNGPRGPALWVVSDVDNTIVEFTPKNLKISGETDPSRVLASADLDGPWGLIFDSRNNLWVSNIFNGTLTVNAGAKVHQQAGVKMHQSGRGWFEFRQEEREGDFPPRPFEE